MNINILLSSLAWYRRYGNGGGGVFLYSIWMLAILAKRTFLENCDTHEETRKTHILSEPIITFLHQTQPLNIEGAEARSGCGGVVSTV
jgi:hypothetical protein